MFVACVVKSNFPSFLSDIVRSLLWAQTLQYTSPLNITVKTLLALLGQAYTVQ